MPKWRGWRLALVLALLVGVAGGPLFPVTPALAAGFTVTTPDDGVSGDHDDISPGNGVCKDDFDRCTLRAAIQEANALAGTDIITLPAGTYTLAGALPTITGPLTIRSQGGSVTIAAGGVANYSILTVNDGTADAIAVSISDLIISGARKTTGGGGGIDNAENLTLTNVAIRDNRTTASGGGIRNNNGSVTIIGGELRDNQAGINGGAIDSSNLQNNPGILSLTGVTIVNNRATSASASGFNFGGAIYVLNAVTTLNNTTVQGNAVGNPGNGYGGGIYGSTSLTLTNSAVSGNTANCRGAGLHLGDNTTITSSTISGNTATGPCSGVTPNEGGGVFKNGGTLDLVNSTVSGNTAANGAGIYNINQLHVRGSTVNNNAASGYGGGLVVRAPAGDTDGRYYATVSNSTLSGNTASGFGFAGGATAAGGALYNSGLVFLLDATLANNSTGLSSQNAVAVLQGTLLANTGANCAADVPDSLVSAGHNLSDDVSCNAFFTGTGDLRNVDPQIGPLASNAPGATQTHALGLASPARDAGSCSLDFDPEAYKDPGTTGSVLDPALNLAVDQRGVARPQRLSCDIGAFEPVNAAPVAAADAYSTPYQTALTVAAPGVLANDTDADSNPLTTSIVTGPSNGGLTLNPDGSFTYVPSTTFGGTDGFTYRVSDGALTSTAAVTIAITGAPSPTPTPSPSSGPSASPSPSPSPSTGPVPSFVDVPTDYWAYPQITKFAQRGITTGCDTDAQGNRYYCPERGVTRAEMAVFITRTLGEDTVAPPATPTFADVPTDYWAYGQIERFAQLGITTGCGVNELGQRLYCPDRGVTRAEMAAFLDRAKGQAELRPATPTFADVPADYWAYGWIERFLALRVTTGCGEDEQGRRLYCPERGVTRAEMAVFIIRAYP